MHDRIEARRILGNRCKDRALGKIQIPDILTEIPFACDLYAETVAAKVDGIQVVLHDQFFVDFAFDLQGDRLFLQLPFNQVAVIFFKAAVDNRILDQLLRNGACAFGFSGSDADKEELQKVSNINEAASINADSDDITYKLKSLFNSQL